MREQPLASVIVNNYNYGRFLKEALDSALGQTYRPLEVVVVDDGSTDHSRDVINRYGERVRPVLKENGGQTSAFNAAFRASRGAVVVFLDADDLLLPGAVAEAVEHLRAAGVAKVHWPLWDVDEQGRRTGRLRPGDDLPEGELRDLVVREGPQSYPAPPTSGNAWARWFLEQVFPLAEVERTLRIGSAQADDCLSMLAPLFGRVARVPSPQGCYRLHEGSDYSGKPFEERLRREVVLFDHLSRLLARYCRQLGLMTDPETWKRQSWYYRVHEAVQEVAAVVPPGAALLLADQDEWGTGPTVMGRYRIPFPERYGVYWGPPADDTAAVEECERLRASGAGFLVFAWPAFWWLDYYQGFHRFLRDRFRRVLANDRLIVFDLGA